jgi:D-alanyl-D-alanine carboxypeptidase (penicillin-binding protein 5/6)
MILGLLLAALPAAAASAPRVTATAAVIMDARTGALIWSRAPDRPLPPASTTKVMTAIMALESGKLREPVVASRGACATPPRKLNLRPGQELVLEDLVYAILLNSANDASSVVAEKLGGSVQQFGERMTAHARAIGARNTQFRNPHGLTEEGHYSSARDQATILRYALKVPKFRRILSTKSMVIEGRNPYRRISLSSHNRLLNHQRIPVIGKTGYTRAAKKCFVGAASHDGHEIVIALLGSNDLWGDAQRLIDFGFAEAGRGNGGLQEARPAAPATASKTKVAAAPPAAAPSRPPVYAVRVGTFDRIDRARRLQRALDRRGYAAAIDPVPAEEGSGHASLYRVEIGPYASRWQAESVRRSIAAEVALPMRVVQR